ncbi:MAG: hypothetical protein GW856_02765 [Cyanobacteria bacterium]|nr:hypothetical protein [Cyanobacteria bacterium CG_2015-16_32_12]
MQLTDHKLPIITGINDVPSVTGQANHPNASLLCQKYNNLIDAVVTEIANLGTVTKTLNTNTQYYIDLTAVEDGDGLLPVTPFNSVASLLEVLNNSIFVNNWIQVYCLSDVDFGHLEITSTLINSSNDFYSLVFNQDSTQTITYDSIRSTIPINISHPLTQAKPISIIDSTVILANNVDVTNNRFRVENSVLVADSITYKASTNMMNSKLKFSNVTITESVINAEFSDLYFDKITLNAGDGVTTFYEGITLNLTNSRLSFTNSTLANYSALTFPKNSTLLFQDVTFSKIDLEFYPIMLDGATVIFTNNSTGLNNNGLPLLRIDDGVIV